MNKIDMRIFKLWSRGITLLRIAKRIGRPGDKARVIDGLKDMDVPESRWYENEEKGVK